MNPSGTFTITTSGEREIIMTREFNAPRKMVFETLTKPEYVKRWLLGPEGWTMPICEIDLRVGGTYRYVWRHTAKGTEMGLHGVFREIAPPERLVHTEQFDQPWYPGEAVVTYTLKERDGRTTMTCAMLYDSRETRDTVLKSGMERGVMVSYDRLDQILSEFPAR
ncbi:MAG TPA: SRPBCC family protein [Candidatus Acidoferrales bacterium]|nr:SRPBCC family protein [Candidatus Acidoferrales bacterium]